MATGVKIYKMTVRVLTSNGVSTYNITGLAHHAHLPDWLAKKNAKALKKDQSWSKRITLIQDFGFPEAALRLKFTPQQGHIIGCGVYKPQMRVFDLHEMSIKFERHLTADTVDFLVLGEEWQKVVLLGADRSIEFHNSGGPYYQTRIPKAGRAMCYDERTCDLLVVGSSQDVYRLNLDRGQFMASLETDSQGGLSGIDIGPEHGLYGVVGDGGLVEFWDRRDRQRAASLQATTCNDDDATAVDMTAIKYVDPLTVAVGDGAGIVRLFDLRSSRPLLTVDHKYGEPIKGIHYHHASDSLLSYDSQALRITKHPRSGTDATLLTTVCPGVKINDVCTDHHSGFLAMAVEDSQIYSFYCPSLGAAPRWASYLDTVINTDDGTAAIAADSVYDNYKFVTDDQLQDLGLSHLRGTNLLRAYMHGHFIDTRLYEKARAIANPFALEQYRREQAARRLEEARQSRIRAPDAGAGKVKSKSQVDDDRFSKLLDDDPDFAVDEDHITHRK